ncbi:hypothetical protein GON03_18930 [Nocardioides sp. MAH-18]|uniref:Uncharacterized protein n=1 Tax=Nocardioides agri TaxID=2682843 RepID=A0A6L6XVM5_9ACTN|nr:MULTISPECIES: hypothetical protein [unclassified Nocardioides]MBA2952091.1 hypothetical protein [Nocardioides sp. CGMCC 1.13656]MVQ51260.1 hypothetical protein [Nocardioides sp. MAH-18]
MPPTLPFWIRFAGIEFFSMRLPSIHFAPATAPAVVVPKSSMTAAMAMTTTWEVRRWMFMEGRYAAAPPLA